MDLRRRPERDSSVSPQPSLSTHSFLLRDVSNMKTPRPYSKNPNPNTASPSTIFFTAAKKTPYSSFSTPTSSVLDSTVRHLKSSVTASASRSKVARRLKALETEQSRSARKAHVRREKKLRSLARSLTAWLNLLLQNAKACGCNAGSCAAGDQPLGLFSKGKRGSLDGGTIDIYGKWRSSKRQRGATSPGLDMGLSSMKPTLSLLEKSLCNICSLEDMHERMMTHMSRECCNEVLLIMSQVCKNIDEGRLKMKLHCPLVTDLAVREKGIKILMCYNPLWLQIGLHILFGGESLLINHEDQEKHFLKEVKDKRFLKEFIEKHFLSHVGIARKYALNRLVGGLYRPGYYEALGNVILKRFLTLVIALDKAKCESSLPIKHGIDSIDGGSPLLFTVDSPIKSSRHVIQEFLADSMHGEGDLLSHLIILGCKFNYQQSTLCEYDFRVKNIFEDFRDGILLCRVVQLLLSNDTILSKVKSPSDTPKKNLQNCSIALQYLKHSGVKMSDSDDIMVTAADLANGDKELTCLILWNAFVHLQIPLLINRASLLGEIAKVKGSDVEPLMCNSINEMDLLLLWIQAVCATQNLIIDSFSSLSDEKVLNCLIKFYFGKDIPRSFLEKKYEDGCNDDLSTHFVSHYPSFLDMAYVQNVTAMLGNYPKVMHPCDILDEDACIDERCTIILLAFHASQLLTLNKSDMMYTFRYPEEAYHSPLTTRLSISRLHLHVSSPRYPRPSGNDEQELVCARVKEGLVTYTSEETIQKIKLIQLWWRGFMNRRKYVMLNTATSVLQAFVRSELARRHTLERSATFIQARLRGFVKRSSFLKMKVSAILLQSIIRAWLAFRFESSSDYGTLACSSLCSTNGICESYLRFMIERRSFHRKRKAIILIQRFVRDWIQEKHDNVKFTKSKVNVSEIHGTVVRQSRDSKESETYDLQLWAAITIQKGWKGFMYKMQFKKSCSAVKIQAQWRCWSIQKDFFCQVEAVKIIQSTFRSMIYCRAFYKKHIAAIEMQRFIRGLLVRNKLLGASKIRSSIVLQRSIGTINDSFMNTFELRKLVSSIIKLQRWWKQVILCRSRTLAIISIQSFIRSWIARRDITKRKRSIIAIQCVWRNLLLNKMKKSSVLIIQTCIRSWIAHRTVTQKKCNILKIQNSWKNILYIRKMKASTLIIQAHVRGWNARQKVAQIKHDIVIIQSCWKGYVIRKHSRPQLLELRHRMELSAANISDEMRLINRLVIALSELLGYRSISNIRQTCATLDMATELSHKCCETLVAAGAIDILLKQIQLLNRGIPDQEVLKYVLSTLRNIVRYKHLAHAVINTPRSVEVIFQEMLRNKNEGFLISCQLLRRLCTIQEGLETARKLQGHVKRLHNVIVKLERKAKFFGRKCQPNKQKDLTARRLTEAISLMSLLMGDDRC